MGFDQFSLGSMLNSALRKFQCHDGCSLSNPRTVLIDGGQRHAKKTGSLITA